MKPILILIFTVGSYLPLIALYSFSGLPPIVTVLLMLILTALVAGKAIRGSGASPSTFSISMVSIILLLSSGFFPYFIGIALTFITKTGMIVISEAMVVAAFCIPVEKAYEIYVNYERDLKQRSYDMAEARSELDSMSKFMIEVSGISLVVPFVLVLMMSRIQLASSLLVYFLVAFIAFYVLSVRVAFRHFFERKK